MERATTSGMSVAALAQARANMQLEGGRGRGKKEVRAGSEGEIETERERARVTGGGEGEEKEVTGVARGETLQQRRTAGQPPRGTRVVDLGGARARFVRAGEEKLS